MRVVRQWVYENNRVHQKQRFMGVRIGQDPFDAFVIQEVREHLSSQRPEETSMPCFTP